MGSFALAVNCARCSVVRLLWRIIAEPTGDHLGGFIAMIVFTGMFYGVFSVMREQVCTTICPYGRLQGVLLDEDSLAVSYDFVRGEPRGKLIKPRKGKRSNCSDGCSTCKDGGLSCHPRLLSLSCCSQNSTLAPSGTDFSNHIVQYIFLAHCSSRATTRRREAFRGSLFN